MTTTGTCCSRRSSSNARPCAATWRTPRPPPTRACSPTGSRCAATRPSTATCWSRVAAPGGVRRRVAAQAAPRDAEHGDRAGRLVSALGYASALRDLRDDLAFEEAAVKRYGHMAAAARDPRAQGALQGARARRGRPPPRPAARDRTRGGRGRPRRPLLPALRLGARLRARAGRGRDGEVPHVPRQVRAAARTRAATGSWSGSMSDDRRDDEPTKPCRPQTGAGNPAERGGTRRQPRALERVDAACTRRRPATTSRASRPGARVSRRSSSRSWDRTCAKASSLLHLQCHFGLDTLSWARLGRRGGRRRLLGRGDRTGAPAGRRSRPLAARHLHPVRPLRRRRPPRRRVSSTSSSSTGAPSSGCPTSRLGRASSPGTCAPAAPSTSPRSIPSRAPSRRSPASMRSACPLPLLPVAR